MSQRTLRGSNDEFRTRNIFPQMYVSVTESVPGTTANATVSGAVVGASVQDTAPASAAIARHAIIRCAM